MGTSRPTFTMYVTPGPWIFSFECSHPREGLLTKLLLWFQSSPPRCISSERVFFPVLILLTSCCEHGGVETRLHVLSEAPAAVLRAGELPCNLDPASSFTAEERFFIPNRLPVLDSFKWDTLWINVQREVDPSSWSFGKSALASGHVIVAGVPATVETLLFMDRLFKRSSTGVTDSFLKRLYLVRWSMPFYLVSFICCGKADASLRATFANIARGS